MKSISFTANYIKDIQVFKRKKEDFTPQQVSFVEFSHPTDVDALNNFRHDLGSSYWNFYDKQFFKNCRLYGLTTQTDTFEKINHKKILGLITTTKDKDMIIQIRIRKEAKTPNKRTLIDKIFCEPKVDRRYKKVGTALLDGLKSVSDRITVFSPKKFVDFFIKNGFSNPLPNDKKYLTWVKK